MTFKADVQEIINSTFKAARLKWPFHVYPKQSSVLLRFLSWSRPLPKSQSVFLQKMHGNNDLIYTTTSEKRHATATTAKMHVCDKPFADKFFDGKSAIF